MKWIIFTLLILNLGFAAWHFQGVNPSQDGLEDTEIHSELQLVLLSEYQQQAKNVKNTSNSKKGKLCYSLGPFPKKSYSEKAQLFMKGKGFNTKQIRLRDIGKSGFWVILPASDSRKQANKHIQRLKKLKVSDYFLVATGSRANAISLGVYSQKKLARKRIDEMIRLGFIPRMESVSLPKKVYWLNWQKNSEIQPKYSILKELKDMFPKISKVERSC